MKLFLTIGFIFLSSLAYAGNFNDNGIRMNTNATIVQGSTQTYAYSPVVVSSQIGHVPSIATTAGVGVSTLTATLKGGRPAEFKYSLIINNGAGGARDYTISAQINGVQTDVPHTETMSGTSFENEAMVIFIPSTTAGSNTFCITIKSSNATGTQTLVDCHLMLVEY